MQRKVCFSEVKEIEGRTVSGIASVFGNIDGGSDRIMQGAYKKTIQESMDRVKHLWGHNWYDPPIAAIKELREVGRDELPEKTRSKYPDATGGLLVVREYLETPRGNEVLAGIRAGAISQMSIGYESVKYDYEEVQTEENGKIKVRNLRELRLWDTSDVVWGMNEATSASKTAVPFTDRGTGSKDAEWKAPGLVDFTTTPWDQLDPQEKSRIIDHFAYKGGGNAFEDLKFPHHAWGERGVGKASWMAVRSAMQDLFGDCGIGMKEAEEVYLHLAEHFKQFNEPVPPFELVKLSIVSNEVLTLKDLTINGLQDLANELKTHAAKPIAAKRSLTDQLKLKLEIQKRQYEVMK